MYVFIPGGTAKLIKKVDVTHWSVKVLSGTGLSSVRSGRSGTLVSQKTLQPVLVINPRAPGKCQDLRGEQVLVSSGVLLGQVAMAEGRCADGGRINIVLPGEKRLVHQSKFLHIEPNAKQFAGGTRSVGGPDALEHCIDALLEGVAAAEAEQICKEVMTLASSMLMPSECGVGGPDLQLRVGMYVLSVDHLDAGIGLIVGSLVIDQDKAWTWQVVWGGTLHECREHDLVPWLFPLPLLI